MLLVSLCQTVIVGQKAPENLLSCVENLPNERVVLITDRDYYLTGDKLWFTAYCFVDNQINSDLSKVLYVELFNEEKNAFVQKKYELKNGMAAGALDIPGDVNTGYYFLRAYTQYQRNFPVDQYFVRALTVINPLSDITRINPSQKEQVIEGDFLDNLESLKNPVALNLEVSKKVFSQREAVELTINTGIDSDLSIVVRKKGTGHTEKEQQQLLSVNPWLFPSYEALPGGYEKSGFIGFNRARLEKISWIPEIRGLTLSGMIQRKSSKEPVGDIYCLTSVIGEEPQLHLAKTHTDGTFVFSYNDLQGKKNMFVAIRNNEDKDLEILINKDFSTGFPEVTSVPLPFDEDQHAFFEELFVNAQLNRAFELPYKKNAYEGEGTLPPMFNVGSPDLVVKVKDFIDIPNMTEVFRELVPSVSVKGKIGNRKLNVFDKEVFKDYDDPVVLLDNVPVNDIEKLLELNPAKMKAIEVYNSNYLLGDYLLGGIISVKTNTDDFAGFKWTDKSVFLPFTSMSSVEIFQSPLYLTTSDKQDKKPDFRTVLYWNPKAKTERNAVKFSFFTSDYLGEYEVIVQGFTKDGEPCYGRTLIEVQNQD
jgi:hypothetical protein